MEGNMVSLLQGGVQPWTGPKDEDNNTVYGAQRQWSAYDQTKPQKITGVIKETRYNAPFGSLRIDSGGKLLNVILAPPPRMDFRGLAEENLNVGTTVSIEAFPSKTTSDEVRATTITIAGRATELR